MEEKKKVEEVIVNNETIYLKRDIFGFRIIHPIKNKDGNYNWLNLIIGGWRNLVTLLFLLLLVSIFFYVYHHDVSAIQKNYGIIASNPIQWCKNVCTNQFVAYTPSQLNFTLTSNGT